MAEAKKSMNDLKDLKTQSANAPVSAGANTVQTDAAPRQPVRDAQGRSYATGKRKDSVARVWIKPGKGQVVVNGKGQKEYFGRETNLLVINQPFLISNRVNQFDVMCTVAGGGLSGQAGAIRHGISKALQEYEPELRSGLKKAGLLTRDDRTVERKKTGKKKARKSKQWAKR